MGVRCACENISEIDDRHAAKQERQGSSNTFFPVEGKGVKQQREGSDRVASI
jgi:hypothetical protein